jgi:hypothetical protein
MTTTRLYPRAAESSPDAAPTQSPGPLEHSSLARRLRLTLFDLGLDRHVPPGWVRPTSTGLVFDALSAKQADRLVCALEDLARGVSGEAAPAGPGHPPLF